MLLYMATERYLGEEISPSEFRSAKSFAKRKLDHIIALYGDGAGARLEVWYFAQLIAETIRANRFSHEIRAREDNSGTKKEQPTHYA